MLSAILGHLTLWDDIAFVYSYCFKIIVAIIQKASFIYTQGCQTYLLPFTVKILKIHLKEEFEQFVMEHTVEAIDKSKT